MGKVLCADKTVRDGGGAGRIGGGGGWLVAVWLDRSVYCIVIQTAGFSRLSLSWSAAELGELLEFH